MPPATQRLSKVHKAWLPPPAVSRSRVRISDPLQFRATRRIRVPGASWPRRQGQSASPSKQHASVHAETQAIRGLERIERKYVRNLPVYSHTHRSRRCSIGTLGGRCVLSVLALPFQWVRSTCMRSEKRSFSGRSVLALWVKVCSTHKIWWVSDTSRGYPCPRSCLGATGSPATVSSHP